VALSADGSTAVSGGPNDSSGAGAAWVFTRSGSAWAQQGTKLVGSGAKGQPEQGSSVALSADGSTALIGGPFDNGGDGAAWVFTRSGGAWAQQGSKLVVASATGAAEQGWSVALSADGDTAQIGGPHDNDLSGAAWSFTRSPTWAQQASLVGSGGTAFAKQGYSVALSGDGNTALIGGPFDNGNTGAAWVFTRSGSSWAHQGSKLIGSGASGAAEQGWSVALSDDGNTALVGGPAAATNSGTAFVFTRFPIWTLQQSALVGSSATIPAGKTALVACRNVTKHGKREALTLVTHVCTAKLASASAKRNVTGGVLASLDRRRVLYARGRALSNRHGFRLLLTSRRRIGPGPYTLRLADHKPASVILSSRPRRYALRL
jgi:FG-GAP repeat